MIAPPRSDLDLTADAARILDRVRTIAPDWVVNLAAYAAVDRAESEPEVAMAVNRDGAAKVAVGAAAAGARLLHLSSDYVFDGRATRPYSADAPLRPIGAYGRSKAAGEETVRAAGGKPLIVRSSWLYGAGGKNFVDSVLARARAGAPLRVVSDQRGSPTWTGSLARGLADLIELNASGTLHLTDEGETTWFDFAVEALALAGLDARVEPVTTAVWGAAAPRPAYSVLDLQKTRERIGAIPHWKESLARYLRE